MSSFANELLLENGTLDRILYLMPSGSAGVCRSFCRDIFFEKVEVGKTYNGCFGSDEDEIFCLALIERKDGV